MEHIDELKQAEGHLKRAETDLEEAQREESAAQAHEKHALQEIEQAVHEVEEAQHHHHEIEFFLDGEEFKTCKDHLTPDQIIMEFGKKDPATNYLVEIKGQHKVSFQGKGEEEIELQNCMNFQIVSTGPTPVSYINGPASFVEGLRGLGYVPQTLPNQSDHVLFDYQVEVGKCSGQTFKLGFVVPADFPNTPPSGPHVSPGIHPINTGNDKPHPTGGVHPSPAFQPSGGNWQYWSRPCPDWGQRKRTVSAYMAHVWRLWETQ